MNTALSIIHVVIAISLVSLILLQSSKGGFASGGGDFYRTKRGAEKLVFRATILLAALFFTTSIVSAVIK